MWSSKRSEPHLSPPAQPTGQDNGRGQLLNLRHIENRLEAAPGSGVLLESIMDTKKSSGGATRKVSRRDGRRTEDCSQSSRSPDKSSRSPLRNTTQDSNVRRNNCVEFKEPLASYREATPPLLTSQLEAHSLRSEVANPPPPDSRLSQLVYQSDTRDQQTRRDLDSTHSSALDSTVVRYLNDRPALDALRPPSHATAARDLHREEGPEDRPKAHTLECPAPPSAENSSSSSPGSASQRLENLRRRQPDDKLEKLKERIRRQREHLEEAAERDGLMGYLDQPVGIAGAVEKTTVPTAKVRKVAAAPPAPIYKGFSSSETKIRTPDGKVWREEEFHNLSREIYRDLSRQLSDSTKPQQRPTEKAKERKPSKPVRKVHKSASVPDPKTKPVISTTSWREGQKMVKMVLGPAPRLPQEQRPEPTDRLARTGPLPRSNSDHRPELKRRSRPSSRDRTTHPNLQSAGPAKDRAPNTDNLSTDIRGILDDLQLKSRAEERGPADPRRGSESRARTTAWTTGGSSLWGSRSASPAKRNKPEPSEPAPRKRHYDADSVRQYIARQQEERKKRQVEERRAQREEAERKSQRLQELYRKQREGVANKGPAVPESPVQKRLQETYTKLLLGQAQLGEEPLPSQTQPASATVIYQVKASLVVMGMKPSPSPYSHVYLNTNPPLSSSCRNELGLGVPSWLQPDRLSSAVRPSTTLAPTTDQLFSPILGPETAGSSGGRGTNPPARPQHSTLNGAGNKTKMNRIEALKATAASLSTRIESEARKLAGAGINYSCAWDMDVTGLTPPDDGHWAKPVSPPVRERADAADELSMRIQRLLSAGQSTYNGALPGVGNLHSFREQRDRTSAPGSRPQTAPGLGSHKQPQLEKGGKTITHDSSGESISEGPLLSECSLSEGDGSPLTNIKGVPKPAEHLGALDFCAGQREGFQPISHFQREAEKYPGLSPLSQQRDSSRGPWEELAKGSPHSVINIFTKNHLKHAYEYICFFLVYSLGLDNKKSPRSPGLSPAGSPIGSGSPRVSPSNASLAGADSLGLGSGSPHSSARPSSSSSLSSAARAEPKAAGELHYTPGVLQQRMSAELNYLESIEESVRQLGDVERLRGVSLAQHESVSLAQILKAQQQRHERDLYELKVKAEQEALETQRQLEETRQKAARAHVELQENMAQTQQQSLGGMQEATTKMISQQAESVRYTAEAARQIKEMTDLARSQIAGAIGVPAAAPITTLFDQQRQHHQSFMKQLQSRTDTDSSRSEVSAAWTRTEEPLSSLDSRSDSIPSRRPTLSGGESSSHMSPSLASSEKRERRKAETGNSSVEEEAHTAADDSIPSDSVQSLLDEKDSTSVATEYSLKFDESMTEDEIEERSFRSLLPSESHRRGAVEKRGPREESDNQPSQEKTTEQDSSKDGSMPFSSGQDSFSRFTMDMVRQYMKEEEVRAHHQSSLLRLRQKALKEKTKAELAWLEHQKRRFRDKGEDDKMPPIRKKQRGLLMKLQQEQAEIKCLQEANRAARKERQLLLKQQEEIERMRYTTLKLKERLKCASTGDTPPETPVSEPIDVTASPSAAISDGDVRSASPLSVSGSETSSIMQKLKKMRSHMEEKHCSPVHYFFCVFTAHHWASLSLCFPNLHPNLQLFIYNQLVRFLTKREQGLMQRRRHAEELLEWKQRLDAEEAEVRHMEKQAVAAWDRECPRDQGQRSEQRESPNASPSQHSPEDSVSEGDYSPVVTGSSVHTELSGSQQPDIPSTDQPCSVSELPSAQHSPSIYTQDFDSPSASRRVRPCPVSDQRDIESRIRALKEELRKRKSVVYHLKKEQKKRHKERLKAQEASLLKQLESYNDFIEKTKTELNKEPNSTPSAKPQIKAPISATEKPKIKPQPPYRSETSKNGKVVSDSEKAEKTRPHSPVGQDDRTQSGLSKYTSGHEESLDEDPPTVTPTPVYGSPEHTNGLRGLLSPEHLPRQPSEGALPLREPARPQATDSGDESVVSSLRSEVMEELDSVKSEGSEHSHSRSEDRHFDHLLKLDLEQRPASQQHQSLSEHVSIKKGEQGLSPISSLDVDEKSPSPIKERSYNPESDAISSNRDFSAKGKEASPSADDYHEDFESSVESSLREDNQGSKPTSPSRQETREASHSRSPFYSSEEDIGEELSERSGASSGSPCSERLLGLKSQTKDSQEKVISSNRSPTISPSQTPPSQSVDEMPNFTIGDRVLVSNVQPGTLRFKGHTSFANGFWAGVELDKFEGSNNGTYNEMVYFECEEGHGIFAPPDKISHLPDKFEIYVETTEDEDSFLDDQSEDEPKKHHIEKTHGGNLRNRKEETSQKSYDSEDKGPTDVNDGPAEHKINLTNSHEFKEGEYPMSNGRTKTIILDLEDVHTSLFSTDIDSKIALGKKTLNETTTLIERKGLDTHQKFTPEQTVEKDALSAFADKLLNNFMKDAVKQFAQIRKAKEEKISASNQTQDYLFNDEGGETVSQPQSVAQRDGLPFFLDAEQEEQVSSPELCNRPESPVLGASGQEELAKRLAELKLSRELLDELGDEQDWFDEDYGLSSHREQQRQKRRQQQEEEGLSAGSGCQVKTPPRPELPLQPKLPEQPAMVVPHSAPEVEKLVHAATQEIWDRFKLGQGTQTLAGLPVLKPSEEFLGCDTIGQDKGQCVRSYRQAVYDLTWEIIQEIFAEDPNAHQPQWVKPRRMNSSYFHRVKSPGDITRVQVFITTEVLKLYGLKKDHNQKTDWQKMLKFGRKKRDRVDHILVQELHEEESQWVNYDEDELYVKMQLADGIFDALIKDTAEVLSQIQEKRSKRALS
uniref:Centrosomal protein 350 n=1 Tax=Salmo trutta TaxID=8032 RepID=A0A674EG32_SALTR